MSVNQNHPLRDLLSDRGSCLEGEQDGVDDSLGAEGQFWQADGRAMHAFRHLNQRVACLENILCRLESKMDPDCLRALAPETAGRLSPLGESLMIRVLGDETGRLENVCQSLENLLTRLDP